MTVYVVETELDDLGEWAYVSWYALDEHYSGSVDTEALQVAGLFNAATDELVQVDDFTTLIRDSVSKKPLSIIVI